MNTIGTHEEIMQKHQISFSLFFDKLNNTEPKEVLLRNEHTVPFLKFLEKKKYSTKLYIAYNYQPGITKFEK